MPDTGRMRPPTVRSAGVLAAAAALAAFAAGSGGAASGIPSRDPCATKPSKGKPHAVAVGFVSATGGKPIVVDVSKLPAPRPRPALGGARHKLPQPSYERAKNSKRAHRNCVPRSAPFASGPAKP